MGLSGRKDKQRIGKDPRNLTWADDAAKFGQSYLSKMGWDPSQGLGVSGDGRTSHIKVAQKLNLYGIGAGTQQGPDGVSWKQNREYEMLLKRLNESAMDEGPVAEDKAEAADTGVKRKRKEGADTETDGDEKRKRKKEKKDKKEKKREKGEKNKEETAETAESSVPEQLAVPLPAPRPMAHRARFLRSKKLAALSSSAAVAEILGIASSGAATPISGPSSNPATPLLTDCGTLTPISVLETDQELTTARKSVADYFKEKLAARASMKSGSSAFAESSTVITTKSLDSDAPRAGLGSAMTRAPEFDTSDTPRIGLGSGTKFGSLMGTFATSSPVSTSKLLEVERPADDIEALSDGLEKSKKKREKREKKKRREEALEEDTPTSKVGKVEAETATIYNPDALEEEKRREKAERKEKKRERKEKRRRKEVDSS